MVISFFLFFKKNTFQILADPAPSQDASYLAPNFSVSVPAMRKIGQKIDEAIKASRLVVDLSRRIAAMTDQRVISVEQKEEIQRAIINVFLAFLSFPTVIAFPSFFFFFGKKKENTCLSFLEFRA